jgi:hypothetical protein
LGKTADIIGNLFKGKRNRNRREVNTLKAMTMTKNGEKRYVTEVVVTEVLY